MKSDEIQDLIAMAASTAKPKSIVVRITISNNNQKDELLEIVTYGEQAGPSWLARGEDVPVPPADSAKIHSAANVAATVNGAPPEPEPLLNMDFLGIHQENIRLKVFPAEGGRSYYAEMRVGPRPER